MRIKVNERKISVFLTQLKTMKKADHENHHKFDAMS